MNLLLVVLRGRKRAMLACMLEHIYISIYTGRLSEIFVYVIAIDNLLLLIWFCCGCMLFYIWRFSFLLFGIEWRGGYWGRYMQMKHGSASGACVVWLLVAEYALPKNKKSYKNFNSLLKTWLSSESELIHDISLSIFLLWVWDPSLLRCSLIF